MQKTTDQLAVGDVILNHGMRILIDGPAKIYENTGGENYPVYAWPGLVLNADELCNRDAPTYDNYIALHIRGTWWEDSGSRPEALDHWTIQGNKLALWNVGAPWREDGVLCQDAGDAGGDNQWGVAASRRFIHTQLPGRVIDIIAYPIRGDGTTPDPAPDAPIRLEWQTWITVCRDVEEPGATEVWADVEYSDLPERFDGDYRSVEAAEQGARALVRSFDPDRHIGWDGKPEMEV